MSNNSSFLAQDVFLLPSPTTSGGRLDLTIKVDRLSPDHWGFLPCHLVQREKDKNLPAPTHPPPPSLGCDLFRLILGCTLWLIQSYIFLGFIPAQNLDTSSFLKDSKWFCSLVGAKATAAAKTGVKTKQKQKQFQQDSGVESQCASPADEQTRCIIPALLLPVPPGTVSVHPGSVGLKMQASCSVHAYTSMSIYFYSA